MASRKAETDQERGPSAVDDRPTKRARVEDEDALDDEEEGQSAPRLAPQASDLYLDTVRHSHSVPSTYILMCILVDKPCQIRF